MSLTPIYLLLIVLSVPVDAAVYSAQFGLGYSHQPEELRSAQRFANVSESDGVSDLGKALTEDAALQDITIIVLRRALGAREQTSVVRRGRFTDDVRFYIETYRGIHDEKILANIQNRYDAAKADLLEPRLSSTIAELVTIIESL